MQTATTNFNLCKNDEGYQNAKMPIFTILCLKWTIFGYFGRFSLLVIIVSWYTYVFSVEFLNVHNLPEAFLYPKTTFGIGFCESQTINDTFLLKKLSWRDYSLPYSVSNDIE